MTRLKRLEWTDAVLAIGVACALAGVYLLLGEAWTLLIAGLIAIAVSALCDLRVRR